MFCAGDTPTAEIHFLQATISKSPRRGLLDQVQAQTPYPPPPLLGSFARDTAKVWYWMLARCKIIILGEKMIPQ